MTSNKVSNKNQLYQKVGDFGNVLLLASTCAVTACMLYKWPSEAMFDSNWSSNGFCVSNRGSLWWNSHTLSFYADTVLAIVIGCLYYTRQSATTGVPPIQQAWLQGSIMAVLGHGLGHLFLGIDPSGMDVRIRTDDPIGSIAPLMVNILGFGSIFRGTMPLAPTKRLLFCAIVASFGITILNIEPKLNFVYAQAAIYISSALNMLSLSTNHKNAAMYSLYPYFQLPVLAVGILESTGCEAILESIGGHAVYDASIGILIILLDVVSTRAEQSRGKEDTNNINKNI